MGTDGSAAGPSAAGRDRSADPSGAAARLRGPGPTVLALIVLVLGVVVTGSVSWSSWTVDRHTDNRLLQVQTRQAAAVIASSVLSLIDPMRATLSVADATGGDPAHFRASAAALVGQGGAFVAASLWRVSGSAPRMTVSVGATPALDPATPSARAFVTLAEHSPTFVVTSTGSDVVARVAYAVSNPSDPRFVVYAERAIPADRQVQVESGSAFTDLHFATYLGAATTAASLATTDLPPSKLPIRGATAHASIPFGDSSITLVTAARAPLGGALARDLPWVLALGGCLITFAAATVAYQLTRRRRLAESDAQTITRLYATLDTLYEEQRSIAYTLQQALLPAYNPSIRSLEIASRYVAGTAGVDVGGDWYSIIGVDEGHFAFVVGDVSGRGLSAATVMARLRFTMRAYLLEGHPPDVVLQMCSRQLDLATDGHFATVLVGVGEIATRTVVLANAGHLDPLIVSGEQVTYTPTHGGLPLGIEPGSYDVTTVVMPEGSTFIAFTDGLVERRGEDLGIGLERLTVAVRSARTSLEELLSHLIVELTDERGEDDIALLAFRWTTTQGATPNPQ